MVTSDQTIRTTDVVTSDETIRTTDVVTSDQTIRTTETSTVESDKVIDPISSPKWYSTNFIYLQTLTLEQTTTATAKIPTTVINKLTTTQETTVDRVVIHTSIDLQRLESRPS